MKALTSIFFIILALAIIGGSQALFTVDERQQAIVLQLGQPVGDIKGPGLHFKIPVIQSVRTFDRRILAVDPEPRQMVVSNADAAAQGADPSTASGFEAVSGEPIIVDTFSRYRISDPLMFMKTLRTVFEANQRLEAIINDATRNVLGQATLADLLSNERTNIMQQILERVNKKVTEDKLGIDIIDIRIVRADLTPDLRQSTVRRMISELKERATETRSKGEERALEIRSRAEKEREIILAEAGRDSEIIKGDGDKQAIKTYIDAFEKDEEFYGFMRSMEAYKNTLANPETRLILSPDSEFFRHFKAVGKTGN